MGGPELGFPRLGASARGFPFLVMEVFTALLLWEIISGVLSLLWEGVVTFSHALFTDDVLVLVRTDHRGCAVIRRVLLHFWGLSINPAKSTVLFSRWATPAFKERVVASL